MLLLLYQFDEVEILNLQNVLGKSAVTNTKVLSKYTGFPKKQQKFSRVVSNRFTFL